MNKISFILISILFFLSVVLKAQPKTTGKLVILHTNDLHSRLNGFSPEAEYTPLSIGDDPTLGGFARIATIIREEKEKNGNDILVLDAGDFLMGSLFHALETHTGFHLRLMKEMGYDVVTTGNHEFDFGPEALASIIKLAGNCASVPFIVASNLVFSEKENDDDSLATLFETGIVQPFLIIEKAGIKIGIIGILGYSAIHDAPLARPIKFADPVKTARKYARHLKERVKADMVICLSHSGVTKDKNGQWAGEDINLAHKVPEIDLIISGHTHTLLNNPIIINNTPIVQSGAYGTGVGRLEFEIGQHEIKLTEAKVIPVTDDIQGNNEIQKQIARQQEAITEIILKPTGLSYTSTVTETSFPLICDEDTMLANSNLGPLIADALFEYVNRLTPQGTDITMFPAGMIRDYIAPGKIGKQSVADIFRVVSLGRGKDSIPGYPLARVYVTGKELKGIMEVLYLAPSGSPDNYIYFGGLKATYNPDKGLLKKITAVETGNSADGFVKVDWSKQNKHLYSITANTYLLEFVGIIKKLSKGLVKVELKDAAGKPIQSIYDAVIDADSDKPGIQEIKEWVALIWYLQQQQDLNGNGIPEVPEYYKKVTPRLKRGE
jgi:5'-nucleotidase